eukprot:sb/3477155/
MLSAGCCKIAKLFITSKFQVSILSGFRNWKYCHNRTKSNKSNIPYILSVAWRAENPSPHLGFVKFPTLGRSCQVLPHYKISSLYLIRGWNNDRGKFHKTQVRAILAWVFL